MRSYELQRAVARATGDSLDTIRRLGFELLDPDWEPEPDPLDAPPQVIDWDGLAAHPTTRMPLIALDELVAA